MKIFCTYKFLQVFTSFADWSTFHRISLKNSSFFNHRIFHYNIVDLLSVYVHDYVFTCLVCVLGGTPSASLFASTMGSSVIRYSISLPHPDHRLVDMNTATPVGTVLTCSN